MKSDHIRIDHLTRVYQSPSGDFAALKEINLTVARGEFLAITGASGSGKSTLLQITAGIDRPTGGVVEIDGQIMGGLGEDEMARWRRRAVGVVFQFFQLLPTLTVMENVLLPMDLLGGKNGRARRSRAMDLLEQVGVADQAHKFPAALSGGQQQRVAVARALANDPPLLVADEPTGNLDSANAEAVVGLFDTLSKGGKTICMVTHEARLARRAHRQIALVDGRLDLPATGVTRG